MKRTDSIGGKNLAKSLSELAEASTTRANLAPESRPKETDTFREGYSQMTQNMFLDLKQLDKLGPLTNAKDAQTHCYDKLVGSSHDVWVQAKHYESYANGHEDAPVGLYSADGLGERMKQIAQQWSDLKEDLDDPAQGKH